MGVYKDSRNESWLYKFDLDNNTYQKYGFESYDAAQKAERQLIRDIEDGKKPFDPVTKNLTFAEASQIFYEEYARHLRQERNYRTRLPIILQCDNMKKRLVDITKDDIRALRTFLANNIKTKVYEDGKLVEKPIKPHTINHYHTHVKAIFQWWIKEKDLAIQNPAAKLKLESVATERIRFLYPSEEKILTPAVMQHPWLFPYYLTALETGLRQANVAGIKVKDIDLTLRQIFVHGNDTKNKESGYIPISERLMPYVKGWMEGKGPEDYLLGNYVANTVSNQFTNLCREVGLKDFSFHCLRHTFAYYHLSRGAPIYLVSRLLLHKDVRVTQKHYGHLAAKDLQDVVDGGTGIVSVSAKSSATKERIIESASLSSSLRV